MGQGISTARAMVLADELIDGKGEDRVCSSGAAILQCNLWSAGNRRKLQRSRFLGTTGESRKMLVATAAKRWSVDPSARHTENSAVVQAATGKRLGYGALVEEAAKLP